ncbi:MAG: 2OG-Fe(II) oxygenase [Rhodospirillaceae bacterium]|nr:2OG-Fe(II) oxygenase [Rhodospirillaceae bacterium]
MTKQTHLPIIDITPFLDGTNKYSVASQVAKACKEIGFLIISGHGIDEKIIETAFRKSREFFDLPQVNKDRYHPNIGAQQRGYHAFASRGLAYTIGKDAPPDLRETYFLGPLADHRDYFKYSTEALKAYAPNIFPKEPDGLDDALKAIYRSYEHLSENLLKIFAIGLEQNENYFSGLIKKHFSILSSHNYPPLRQPPKKDQLRTGAHTDFGAITILAMTEAAGGLEILMPNQKWLPVQPPNDCLVVNLGDMMARWTNDHWKSTLHRVVNPKNLNDQTSRRQTIGYFMHPDYDTLIEVLPSCIGARNSPKFKPISAGQHIAEKIRASHEGSLKDR